MRAGSFGTHAIAWSQTESDGIEAAPPETLALGSTWSWHGEAVALASANPAQARGSLRDLAQIERAARRLDRLYPAKLRSRPAPGDLAEDDSAYGLRRGFSVTDGLHLYPVSLLGDGEAEPHIAVFPARLPPAGCELWVTDVSGLARIEPSLSPRGIICFTVGTWLRTETGPCRVEDLLPGQRLLTRDNGPQEVIWIGSSRVSGARLHSDPSYRPIRISARALGEDQPEAEILVSPRHRILLRGRAAQILFNADEVLASARDLVNDFTIRRVMPRAKLVYYHVLLPRHEVVWANGLACESFHPADMDLSTLAEPQRDALFRDLPALAQPAQSYGAMARRSLTPAEAALYLHDHQRRLRL